MFISAGLYSLCTEQYEWFKFLANSGEDQIGHFLCVDSWSNKHFLHSCESNTGAVTSVATLQINLSVVCSTVIDNLQMQAPMDNKPSTLIILLILNI